MKKQIHTSPVAEAFLSGDECPFCYLQRDAEQRSIRYFAGAGASYMEPEVRGITNRLGFCTDHTKKLYDYGNSLGNALMLQTHMENVLLMLQQLQTNPQAPVKKGLFSKKSVQSQPLWLQIRQRADSCAICQRMEESQQRHIRVFFDLLKETEFRSYVEQSKGFLPAPLCPAAAGSGSTSACRPAGMVLYHHIPTDDGQSATGKGRSGSSYQQIRLPQCQSALGQRPGCVAARHAKDGRHPSGRSTLPQGLIKQKDHPVSGGLILCNFRNYRAALAFSTIAAKAAASWIAISDRLLRFSSMPAFFRPFMNLE